MPWGHKGGLDWVPIPRLHVSELSYKRFLLEFALPRVPCIIGALLNLQPNKRGKCCAT